MKNSLVRIGGVEGEWVKRALTALIRPSSHQQRRRSAFEPRPSRLSVMSKAEDLWFYLFFNFTGLILLITLLRWLIFTHCVDLLPDWWFRRAVRLKRVFSGEFWEQIDESDIGKNYNTVEEFLNRSIEIDEFGFIIILLHFVHKHLLWKQRILDLFYFIFQSLKIVSRKLKFN
jgi:hypothetical protein